MRNISAKKIFTLTIGVCGGIILYCIDAYVFDVPKTITDIFAYGWIISFGLVSLGIL